MAESMGSVETSRCRPSSTMDRCEASGKLLKLSVSQFPPCNKGVLGASPAGVGARGGQAWGAPDARGA